MDDRQRGTSGRGGVDTDPLDVRGKIEQGRLHAQLLLDAGTVPVEVLGLVLELLRAHGDDAGLLSDAAALLHACGRPDHAAAVLLRALDLDPDHPDALANGTLMIGTAAELAAAPEALRLNVGAGDDRRPGFISVDLREDVADVVAPADALPFPDGSAAEVLALDILEHVPSFRTQGLLREWHRVLAPGGRLTCRVPNLAVLGLLLARGENLAQVIENVYGGHRWGPEGAYDAHHHGFTPATFVQELSRAGFAVHDLDNLPNMTAVAVKA